MTYAAGSRTPSVELKAFLDAHAEVSVNQYRDDQGNHALHEASFWGHAACVRMLLDHGADVHARDGDDWTVLMHACSWDRQECVQILIEAKADVNASRSGGYTAAHSASGQDDPKCLQLLIDNHVDVDARTDDGRTPAMGACEQGRLRCVQLLVDNKADLNVRNNWNRDALHWGMRTSRDYQKCAFAFLCCNTDAKNLCYVTQHVIMMTCIICMHSVISL
jgi:ankyrin repeat protein